MSPGRTMAVMLLWTWAACAMAGNTDARAHTNYLLHCSGCHQADGSGNVGNGIPRMQGQVGHFLRLPEGRAFLVQVPGTSQSSLNDADVAQLLNWMVRALSPAEVPTDFQPYTTDEVTRLRSVHLADAPAARQHVVERLRQDGFKVD